jgi:phospholipase/carboxylesterase
VPNLNLTYRHRQPETSTEPFPALVLVHGWLGDENSMWAFQQAFPAGTFVISVRAPFAVENGYGWTVPGDEDSFERGLTALDDFIKRLPGAFPVDAGRITLMGFSQGAAMCYASTLKSPELTRATAALAGFLPPQARPWVAPNRLQGRLVFITHGTEDPTVPVDEARKARDLMQQCGAEVTYHESPSTHKLSAHAMRELKDWLAL